MTAFSPSSLERWGLQCQLLGRENNNHNYIRRGYCSLCPYSTCAVFISLALEWEQRSKAGVPGGRWKGKVPQRD